jgi:long-chain acyl-CoA synthetase
MISTNNRTEWSIMDIGILQTAQNVPIYPTITADDYMHTSSIILAQLIVLSDVEIFEKINTIHKVPKH